MNDVVHGERPKLLTEQKGPLMLIREAERRSARKLARAREEAAAEIARAKERAAAAVERAAERGRAEALADQLYAAYARGRDLRRLVAIVGESGLGDDDRRYLTFADAFEQRFLHQGDSERSLEQTLDAAWQLLAPFADAELKRISPELIARFRPPRSADG
jgi:V/A-type H+-transporting ATPase subunit B